MLHRAKEGQTCDAEPETSDYNRRHSGVNLRKSEVKIAFPDLPVDQQIVESKKKRGPKTLVIEGNDRGFRVGVFRETWKPSEPTNGEEKDDRCVASVN